MSEKLNNDQNFLNLMFWKYTRVSQI